MRLFIFSIILVISSLTYGAEVSITMDDFNVHDQTLLLPVERNERILATLKKHKITAGLFVACKHLKAEEDRKLLRSWPQAGHFIANHTTNHIPFSAQVSVEEEIKEIKSCEDQLKKEKGFEKMFRYPMLAEGDTPEKRDAVRAWLQKNGYQFGHVTIDASDWYIDQRLREKYKKNPHIDMTKFRDFYLQHMWERAQYYNDLSKKVLGREVKHTLLVHFNLLNALYLNDLIEMFKSKGWKVIDAKSAFQDPVFKRLPKSMPSGQSVLWGIAKESGHFDKVLRYPGESDIYEKRKMDVLGL